jgi:hypothetical protein
MKREKTYRIKTNNQELLIRKENESDATSRWIITGNEKEILLFAHPKDLELII